MTYGRMEELIRLTKEAKARNVKYHFPNVGLSLDELLWLLQYVRGKEDEIDSADAAIPRF